MTDTGYVPAAEPPASGPVDGGEPATEAAPAPAEQVRAEAPPARAEEPVAGTVEGETEDAEELDEEELEEVEEADTDELFRQSEIAADYIEGLLDVLDMDGDIDELVANGRPMVEVIGDGLQSLIGPRGATLEALQELARLAIYRRTGSPSRLLLEIGGYRAARREELTAVARNAIERVREFGQPVKLEPMTAFERKCIHDVINVTEGVVSESYGVEPNRRVVVRPV
ncbi:MAG: R3H domain-containing nucleic acid-binding protein [Micromonosporaceae bacterium]